MTAASRPALAGAPASSERYQAVRRASEALCRALELEDYGVQSAPEISPTKWHLAHTSWFFETFVLAPYRADYRPFDPSYEYLFNSYYNGVGAQFTRPQRGVLSRPTVAEVFAYRQHVDRWMHAALHELPAAAEAVVTLGLHHEQQHQELMLMDLKHVFSCNPQYPAYTQALASDGGPARPAGWLRLSEGLYEIGTSDDAFAFDNERPRHPVYLQEAELADRLVTNQEYLAFIADDGYRRPELWLADGWDWLNAEGAQAPLYWVARNDEWCEFTLSGLQALEPAQPVCHLSYYEADAFARWAGARLPFEAEWEALAAQYPVQGRFVESQVPQPSAAGSGDPQLFGDAWEWTHSAYAPYPGYQPPQGALGEYNGKFMCNQQVLRGGCCVTPASHIRATYRNFFYPWMRWPFTGLRLARSV